jgi:hypothetical protein
MTSSLWIFSTHRASSFVLHMYYCSLVGEVNVVVDKGRVDGSRVRLAEVEVGDETGVVSLRARNEQIDLLKQVSERSGAVVLRNCTLELYQGKHVRLAVTKWGKLSTYPDQVASTPPPPSKMNPERNFSLIDLSIVASEMVVQTEQYGHSGHSSPESGAATSGGNRQSSFQTGATTSRRGVGRRQSPRGKFTGHNPISMPVHYGEQGGMVPAMRYQPYPGSYGENQPYSYSQQQYGQNSYQQQQHQQGQMMMHQQQYEMQQRQMQQQGQMQHQMYHTGAPQDRQHPGHSPMVLAVSTTGSFENAYSVGSEIPMPLVSSVNQFGIPIPGGGQVGGFGGSTNLQHQEGQASSPPTTHYPSHGSHGSPMSPGRMSANAATFDPTHSSRTNQPGAK